jgi:glycosyltransferase involved in cell wall biosynthesis
MKRTLNILVINACGTREGDANMLLLALSNWRPDQYRIDAVSVPRGEVFEALSAIPNVEIVGLEMGGVEAQRLGRQTKAHMAFMFLSSILQIALLVKRRKIDVIYVIDRTVAPKIAALVSCITKCPFVLCSAFPGYPRASRWNRFVVHQAHGIHVHSEYLRGQIAAYTKKAAVLKMIPNALQVERYSPAQSPLTAREALKIAPETIVVLMPGRLSPFKGQSDLVEAAPFVLQKHPNVLFLIAGRDTKEAVFTHGPHATSFKAILKNRIAELNLTQQVRLVGYYPDLIELLAAADIVTMPSWEEPFGLVALEGMAMAKPVVSTRAGGVPEFMRDEKTGYLIPPREPAALAEALLKLLKDPLLAQSMGHEGRRCVEESHTAQVYAAHVAELLHAVICVQ